MEPDAIFQIVSGALVLLLMVSEYLPFSTCEYNGVLQALVFTVWLGRKREAAASA